MAKADGDGAADDAVADVQFVEVRHGENATGVFVVEAVASVDAEAKRLGLFGDIGQALKFGGALGFVAVCLGVGAGVQFDERAAGRCGGLDLCGVGVDEQAHHDAGLAKRVGGGGDGVDLPGDVEPAFGGDLGAVLRHKHDGLRLEAQGDVDHLRRVGHLEVEPRLHRVADGPDVAVENMPAILAKMGGDAVRAGGLGVADGVNGAWLAVGEAAITRLPQRGHVVDVDSESQHRFAVTFCRRPSWAASAWPCVAWPERAATAASARGNAGCPAIGRAAKARARSGPVATCG